MEMGGKVDKFRIEILLDGHGLYEVQEIVLELGDLVDLHDGIYIHGLIVI